MISRGKAIINLLLSMCVRPLFSPVGSVLGWAVAAFLLLGTGPFAVPARADIQEPIQAHTSGQREQRRSVTPAAASPREVQIHQGETIEIVLTAHGQIGRTVTFLMRSQPEHGTLEGPPRQLTRNTASVTYVHRADDGPGDDIFTYAVQVAGGVVSAAVPVTITVMEEPPSLATSPTELDFGTVKAGDNTRATLTLENRGGGTAFGRVEPPPPWTVEGAAEYHLAHGASQTFQIVFGPSYGRSYVESIHFRPETGNGVRLIGTGIGPRDPAEDADGTATSAIAASIARGNALARAAENAALAAPDATPPMPAAAAPAARAPAVPVATQAITPAPPPAAPDAGAAVSALPVVGGKDSVVLNTATVKTVEVRDAGVTTLDLAWTPPRPVPKAYRVEMRYLTLDADDNLRVDWRPYAQVDIRSTPTLVTARLSGLAAGTRPTLRVVAVDSAGRLAAPSATLMATLRQPSTWWHVTPLRVLFALLALCLGLLIYRKWEDQQILRSIDESRAARNEGLMYRP